MPAPDIRNVSLTIPEDQRAQFVFAFPWRVESRVSRFHPWVTVRPCKTLEAAVELYEFLGEWPRARVRAN